MKNKWVRSVLMFLVGIVALSVGQNMGSDNVIANITVIVGTILMIGGVVEIFRKRKKEPPVA